MAFMHPPDKLKDILPEIETKLKLKFQNTQLLLLAFVHRSYVNEAKGIDHHNERLEFLGDSVLGLIVADFLYKKWPDKPEGTLSRYRSLLVEAQACIKYMHELDLESYILMGKGESQSIGRGRETILANVFEALIGSIYLDQGIEKVRDFFFNRLENCIAKIIQSPSINYKAELQDLAQRNHQVIPEYKLVEETGPDHAKEFLVAVLVQGKEKGQGKGNSKKQAEQKAAKEALKKMKCENEGN